MLCRFFRWSALFLLVVLPASAQKLDVRYRETARRIIAASQADSVAYDRIAHITDSFGPRLSGSEGLERAIDWIVESMKKDGLDRVRTEPVMVPVWMRGEEKLTMITPRPHEMKVLGLGGSVGTDSGPIEADVLVVSSFDELEQKKNKARGKIVLFNAPFTSYGETVQYRVAGAIRAARTGAIASLIRSVTPFSMQTPHTGTLSYDSESQRIPGAAITVEDAMMLQRMQDRGQRIRLRLEMGAKQLPDVESRNIIAEIRGSEKPDEIVVLGGHVDSWDVGTGAMDDMGGCVASWQVLKVLKELGLRPRRTIRVVLWANEENGLRGGNSYRDAHAGELSDHVLAIETDSGVFKPQGFGFSGTDAARAQITEIARLLDPISAGMIQNGGGGADIGPIMRHGVPGMGLIVDTSRYMWFHHTEADTVDKLDPKEVNLSVATMAVMAFVVADMPERLPRIYTEPTK